MTDKFEQNMDIGEEGYCLVPGHPKRHKMDLECWGKLRSWLLANPKGTESQYKRDCEKK